MGCKSKQAEVSTAVRAYLVAGERQPLEQCQLDVTHVAAAIGVSRTSIYKYGLVEEIRAAAQRQQERVDLKTGNNAGDRWRATIQQLRKELVQAEERNRLLLARLNLIEANAARLGIDPEELYRPLVKPIRSVSRHGRAR
ncbi:MAG: hypothetical protein WAM60_18845 [Candidatus Promineifilaceae bacterium]